MGGCPNPPCLDANIWRNFNPSLEYVNNPSGNIAGATPSVMPPATPMPTVDPLTPLGFTTEQLLNGVQTVAEIAQFVPGLNTIGGLTSAAISLS